MVMGERERALMVTSAMPSVTGNGLAMRLGLFFESLAREYAVDLLVAPVAGPVGAADLAWAEALAERVLVVDVALTLDTHFGLVCSVADFDACCAAFRRYGKPSLGGRLGVAAQSRCREMIGGGAYQVVHVNRSYCAPLALALARGLRQTTPPVLTIDLDEDDRAAYGALADLQATLGRCDDARWNALESEAYARLVADVAPSFDRLWVSSPIDAAQLQPVSPRQPIRVVPNAVPIVASPARRDDGRTLMFVGSLAFEPNEDAVAWFAEEILPLVRQRGVRFVIAGTNPSARVQQLAEIPGIDVTGWVPDLTAMYECTTLAVVPLRSGAGTRIKILESAAHGVPVVSTSLGAAGLGLIDGRDVWIADTSAAFADAIIDAFDRPDERRTRADAARRWVMARHDRARVIDQLAEEFRALR